MHKLMEFVCDQMEELEKKAEKGNLSMQDIQLLDTLAHTKKNLLKADEMWEDSEYSMDGGSMRSYARGRSNRGSSYRGGRSSYEGGSYDGRSSYDGGSSYEGRSSYDDGSYARRRDSRGRYSRDEGMVEELRELMEKAPDEQTKREFQRLIQKMEQM